MRDYADFVLGLLQVATACIWPLTVLFILFLFRRQLAAMLPRLEQRLTKAEVAGAKFEFSVAVDAFKAAVEMGVSAFKDNPDQMVEFVQEQIGKLPSAEEVVIEPGSRFVDRSILWVDDNPQWNYYESGILERLGARIVRAHSTREALVALERKRFNLVISDVKRLEDGRENREAGYDLLDGIVARFPVSSVIFYMSNVAFLDRRRASQAFGAADNPDDLFVLVARALAVAC